MQQTKHKIEEYSDLEINSFNYMRAEGFNTQTVFTLVMDQFWTDEDIQIIIEAARGITINDTVIAAISGVATIKAADTACVKAGACTTAEDAANLTARKAAIATNQILDFYLRLEYAIQLHKLNYPVQTTEVLADSAFKRISDSASTKISLSYKSDVKSNIFDYGLTLTNLVDKYITKPSLVKILDEADRLCVTTTTQTEDATKNLVAYKTLTEPELATLRIQ